MFSKSQVAGASSVTDMLREDHKKVKGLFEEFEQAGDAKRSNGSSKRRWQSLRCMPSWKKNSSILRFVRQSTTI